MPKTVRVGLKILNLFFMNWYLKVLKQYADFNGRARRQEFWMFYLFNVIANIILSIIDALIGMPVLSGLYWLFILVPSLAVTVRRLHDIGKSGGYFFVVFIPLAGPIWLLIMMIQEGLKGENQYGQDPKQVA